MGYGGALLRTTVRRITATRDKVEIEVYLDFGSVLVPSRTDTHAGHYYHQDKAIYCLEKPIPSHVFIPGYPETPKTFGEHLRKARMDAGLQIKELAAEIGVSQDSVINWELRGKTPCVAAGSALVNQYCWSFVMRRSLILRLIKCSLRFLQPSPEPPILRQLSRQSLQLIADRRPAPNTEHGCNIALSQSSIPDQ